MTGYFGGYSQYSQEFLEREIEVAQAIVRAVADTGRPIVAQSMYHASSAQRRRCARAACRSTATIEAAAAALAALRRAAGAGGRAGDAGGRRRSRSTTGYYGARELLERAGVPFVGGRAR